MQPESEGCLSRHRTAGNPSGRARFIANNAVTLREPMNFNRPDPADYSLVELAVLKALGAEERLDGFKPSGQRGAVPPGPFRSPEQREEQQGLLLEEMARMAALGYTTPDWARDSYTTIDGTGEQWNAGNGGGAKVWLDRAQKQKEVEAEKNEGAAAKL